ncbi:MAG: U32 family peptidase, partial [Ignavibacteria bacterium]|nr:U32 family peptidase [Ignavibacteria bacterium]
TLSVGDEILITGTTTGILQTTVNELRVAGVLTDKVTKGQPFTMSIERKVRLSDKLFKLVSS